VTPFADSLVYTYDSLDRAIGPTIMSSGPSVQRSPTWLQSGILDTLRTKVNTATSWKAGEYSRVLDVLDDPVPTAPLWKEQTGSGTATVSRQDTVAYDGWERVIGWQQLKNGVPIASEAVTYDRSGNVRTADQEVYDVTTERLLQRTAGGHRFFYVYDRAGNLITQRDSTLATGAVVVTTYAYDALNQMRNVRRGATLVARYAYDVRGRRIAKRVYSAVTGGTVEYARFVYRGGYVIFETDSQATSIQRSYTWGVGTDDLVAVREGGSNYYVTQDKLGSVRALSKRDGTHAISLAYAPWGRLTDSVITAGVALRYRWTGREYDAESGFYFHRARYYSPLQRRFVQEDPIGFSGGTNVYAYVAGQVLEATDPDGRMFKCKGGGGGSRFFEPGRNDMGLGDRGDRLDPWQGDSYLAERTAQRMADYEAWVAAGSMTSNGERVLATESAAEFLNRVLDAKPAFDLKAGIVEVGPVTPVAGIKHFWSSPRERSQRIGWES
jgi:RHS repeat-associated protein